MSTYTSPYEESQRIYVQPFDGPGMVGGDEAAIQAAKDATNPYAQILGLSQPSLAPLPSYPTSSTSGGTSGGTSGSTTLTSSGGGFQPVAGTPLGTYTPAVNPFAAMESLIAAQNSLIQSQIDMFAQDKADRAAALASSIRGAFQWAYDFGFGDIIEKGIQEGWSPEQHLAEIRQSSQYEKVFPGMRAEDGSRRFSTEAEYMQTVASYRDVLREFDMYDPAVDSAGSYEGLFDLQIDPNEFRDRLTTYKALERGSQEQRDAFYVFAGLDVSVDDLYQAVVEPDAGRALVEEYSRRLSQTPLDWDTYVTRVTDVALARLTETTQALVERGLLPSHVQQQILDADPNRMRELVGALGAQVPGGERERSTTFGENFEGVAPLGMEALVTSFQYAVLASAATEQGLLMPGKERLEEFRQIGVTRARANQAYGRFASQKNLLGAMGQRAGVGTIGQDIYEQAVLLGKGTATDMLTKSVQTESALGRATGGFANDLQGRRVTQLGRRL